MSDYAYWAEDSSEAIEHHGILGQKWGVRRYQNEDGTLTADGKQRYLVDKNKGPIANIKGYIQYRKDRKEQRHQERREAYKRYTEEEEVRNTAKAERDAIRKTDISVKEIPASKKAYGSDMSNDELRAATQRLLNENQYKQALFKNRVLSKQLTEQDRSQMSKIASQIGVELSKEAVKYATKGTWSLIEKGINKGIDSIKLSANVGDIETFTFNFNNSRPTHADPGATLPKFNMQDVMNTDVTWV